MARRIRSRLALLAALAMLFAAAGLSARPAACGQSPPGGAAPGACGASGMAACCCAAAEADAGSVLPALASQAEGCGCEVQAPADPIPAELRPAPVPDGPDAAALSTPHPAICAPGRPAPLAVLPDGKPRSPLRTASSPRAPPVR